MKKLNMTLCLVLLCISAGQFAMADTLPAKLDLKGFEGTVTKSGDSFIGGQPSLEALTTMKQQGVVAVISLRTDKEHKDRELVPFDEAQAVKAAGMNYYQLPLGTDDSYTPEVVAEFSRIYEESNGHVLLHCRSARRASYLWTAFLVKHKHMDLETAQQHGDAINLGNSPLEGLLNADLVLTIKDNQ